MTLLRYSLLVCLLLSGRGAAQFFTTGQVDTFYFTPDSHLVVTALGGKGMVWQPGRPPQYPHRFWPEGDLWLSEAETPAAVFYLFGTCDAPSPQLWAAGYSLLHKQILLVRILLAPDSTVQTRPIAAKPVEILNMREWGKYVFRIIFRKDTKEIQVEVNGVPLRVPFPVALDSFSCFGYLVSRGTVRFEPFHFGGD
ncbi:MAG: hypothetical protein D6681_18790 [Calditrichaeota bacterium]|nr:MAG: hypothetical protein D6681_18790 [Calditrichota bacterium]